MSSMATILPAHPYYPPEVEIIGYIANEWDTLTLVSIFAAVCTAIFSVTYVVVNKVRSQIPLSELSTILWFVLCTEFKH